MFYAAASPNIYLRGCKTLAKSKKSSDFDQTLETFMLSIDVVQPVQRFTAMGLQEALKLSALCDGFPTTVLVNPQSLRSTCFKLETAQSKMKTEKWGWIGPNQV